MRIVRISVVVLLATLTICVGLSSAAEAGGRNPLDAADIRTGGKADKHASEFWPGSYGGYWVTPVAFKGPFTFHFAFTRGQELWKQKLEEMFPLNRGRYVIERRSYTWTFLLRFQRQVSRDLQKIKQGELKAPGLRPWQVGSYPSPERDCLVLEKGPLEKSFRKWAKERYGDKVCLDQMFSGFD